MKSRQILYQVSVFIITALAYASIHACRTSWSSVKFKLKSKGLTDDDFGNCDTVFLLAYGIGNLVFGHKGDSIDLRLFVGTGILSTIISFGSLIFFGFYQLYQPIYFYILFAFNGLSQSLVYPGVLAIMGNWFGHASRGFILGLWGTNGNIGNTIGYQFGDFTFDTLKLDWQYVIIMACSFSAIMGLFVGFILKPYPENVGIVITEDEKEESLIKRDSNILSKEEQESLNESIKDILQDKKAVGFFKAFKVKGVLVYTLVYACIKSANYTLLFWLKLYLSEQRTGAGSGVQSIPQYNEIATICGTIFFGWFTDKIGSRAIPIPFLLIISSICLFFVPSIPDNKAYLLYILIPLSGLTLGTPYNQIGTAIASDIGKDKNLVGQAKAISTIIGIIQGIGGVCAALSQKVSSYLSEYIFYFVAGLLATAALLIIPLACRDFQLKIQEYKAKKQQEKSEIF